MKKKIPNLSRGQAHRRSTYLPSKGKKSLKYVVYKKARHEHSAQGAGQGLVRSRDWLTSNIVASTAATAPPIAATLLSEVTPSEARAATSPAWLAAAEAARARCHAG